MSSVRPRSSRLAMPAAFRSRSSTRNRLDGTLNSSSSVDSSTSLSSRCNRAAPTLKLTVAECRTAFCRAVRRSVSHSRQSAATSARSGRSADPSAGPAINGQANGVSGCGDGSIRRAGRIRPGGASRLRSDARCAESTEMFENRGRHRTPKQ